MLEHWKTLQEGWVNALDTLYDLLLILDNLTTAQINPRHEKMQISFCINQFHLFNNSMFLETICFVLFCTRFFICTFIFLMYIFILEMLGKLL